MKTFDFMDKDDDGDKGSWKLLFSFSMKAY